MALESVDMLGVTLGFGLPWVAGLIVLTVAVDRLLRISERHGFAPHRLHWTAAGIGNALLQLHVSVEPQRARIETRLALEHPEPGDRIGAGPLEGTSVADNVIPIDFIRRRRR